MSKIYSLALHKARQEGNDDIVLDRKVANPRLEEQTVANDHVNAPRQPVGTPKIRSEVSKAAKRRGRQVDERLVAFHNTNAAAVEQYRKLFFEIARAGRVRALRTLLICSALEHEGKSLTALNLAIIIASQGGEQGALLVETDFRRPRVQHMLGTQPEGGLSDYILGDIDYERIFVPSPIPGLTVVHAGQWVENPMLLLNSQKMVQFFERVKSLSQYSHVILDTSPIILTAEPTAFIDHVDAALFVVHAKKTPREIVLQAIDILGEEKILGCVFNGVTAADTRNYRYHYRSDYYLSGRNSS